MRVSTLTYVMNKDDVIVINRKDKPHIYNGFVKGIKKENPINQMHVLHLYADGDVMVVTACEPRKGGAE